MINKGVDVPPNTIAIFNNERNRNISLNKNRFNNIIETSSKKREWFTPHFYRCLPLTIGNQYGFIIKSEFSFSALWNGGDLASDITFKFDRPKEELDLLFPQVISNFGNGIITIDPPYTFRTPPGVNIMTINPPNTVIPNITVMTGVVETDNVRRNFTFNLKIQTPNIETVFLAGTPLAGFIPIPRNFADKFNMVWAEEIFDEEIIIEELQADIDHLIHRESVEPNIKNHVGKFYMNGIDIYGNNFLNHQKL